MQHPLTSLTPFTSLPSSPKIRDKIAHTMKSMVRVNPAEAYIFSLPFTALTAGVISHYSNNAILENSTAYGLFGGFYLLVSILIAIAKK